MTEAQMKQRTKQFALRVIKLIGALPKTIEGRVRCQAGDVEEEADECAYWLELLVDGGSAAQ